VLKDRIIITAIWSTTTKAIFLRKVERVYLFLSDASAFTTVEKPD